VKYVGFFCENHVKLDGKVLSHLGFKSKVIARAFNWLRCLGGIMHLKPTAGCQISTLIFGFFWSFIS